MPSLFSSLYRPGESGHMDPLDGLRALAVTLVILFHPTTLPIGSGLENPDMEHSFPIFFQNGWVGVDLFFVLSGFLIFYQLTGKYAPTKGNIFSGTFAAFYKNRFLRIFPAYFTIVLLLLPDPLPFYGTDTKDPVRSFFVHAAFLQDYLGADLAGHLWSLGVEVKFYLLAPLIALAFWKFGVRPGVAFFLLVWAGCVAGRWWDAVSLNVTDYPSYLTHIRTPFHHSVDGFVAGALSCLLYRSEWGQRHILSNRLRSNLLGLVGWGGFLLFMLSADQVGNLSVLHQAGMPFYLATCFGLILVSLLGQGWGKKLWGHAALYPLAILSYPLYLTHWLCLALAFALAAAGTFPVWGFSFWTIYVGSALISSLILHLAVERPFLARYRH